MSGKNIDKEAARALRTELYAAVAGGELPLQEAVKRMRKISRLTQAEFAAHRGVGIKAIKEIENGRGNPTVETLNKIGKFFGLEVAFVRTATLQRQPEADPGLQALLKTHPPQKNPR